MAVTLLSGGSTTSNPQPLLSGGSTTNGNLLNQATSAAGLIGTVFGALGVDLGTIAKYGLNSIGATTNPTKELTAFEGFIVPLMNNYVANVNEANVAETLTKLEQFLEFLRMGYKHLLEHHTRANSTRAAYQAVTNKILELKQRFVTQSVDSLKAQKATITTTTQSKDFNFLENSYPFLNNQKFDTNHKYTVTSKIYKVTLPKTVLDNPVNPKPIVEDATKETIYDEEGNVQTANFGWLAIAFIIALVYALFNLVKSMFTGKKSKSYPIYKKKKSFF